MSQPMIQIQELGKKYQLRHQLQGKRPQYRRLSEEISSGLKGLLGSSDREEKVKTREEFWALREVSFEVSDGEVIGIIGRNGAGKSTLLKLLSRITEPSEGRFQLNGRVAALLEVGTGFHPELTGRENIFLNGAVLGMSKQEIRSKFDEIVEFANVERFLDTPVKRFSSGMSTRLAFSIAAHLEPEILIIDEVLAVGDFDFQRKCLGKMKEVSRSGRTVLFVSHNLSTIASLTDRCIQLQGGQLVEDGPTSTVIQSYVSSGTTEQPVYNAESDPEQPFIQRIEVVTSEEDGFHRMGSPLEILVNVKTPDEIRRACLSLKFISLETAQPVQNIWLFDAEQPWGRGPGLHRLQCAIPNSHLFMGDYMITAQLAEGPGGRKFQLLENVCPFRVEPIDEQRIEYPFQSGEATATEDFSWTIEWSNSNSHSDH